MKTNSSLILNMITKFSLLIIVVIFLQSCESDIKEITESSEYKFSLISKNDKIKYLENQYVQNNKLKSRDIEVISDKMYKVDIESGKSFYISEISDNLNLNEDYTVKNYAVNVPFSNGNKTINFGYILREISKNDVFIREIINPKTGEIIDHSTFGISEDDYFNLRRSYSDNKFDSSLLKGNTCFTTFDACFQHASFSNGSPLDQSLCEWLPCKTVAYIVCTIAEQEGWIEESDCFTSCSACDVIIGEE